MTRFPTPITPSAGLRAGRFVLEPLGPEHNNRDFAAWTSSVAQIRATPGFAPEDWGGDRWPYEMGVAENLADLERHAAEFAAGEAFAYTVLDRFGDVIGCVYVDPDPTGEAEAICRMWVSAGHAGLDADLFDAVRAWLAGPEWPLARVRYPGRDG